MIGDKLQYVRTYHGDRQIDLAKKLNVALSTIKSWERNNSSPNYGILVQICKFYHVSSDYLLGITDADPFIEKEVQEKLSPKEKAQVRLFEEFLLYKQQKDPKK